MNSFHGGQKKRSYFEGWYCKQQSGGETVALIPACHIDQKGEASASLQIITDQGAWNAVFPARAFRADPRRFCVQIAGSTFCEKGLLLNLHTKELSLTGKLRYGAFTPLSYDIMGPFRYVPALQCRHGVLSLTHSVNGHLEINGRRYDFQNGTGYVETDRGTSFPKSYLWTQCNFYEKNPCCVMLSVADVPVFGFSFTGCICSIYYNNKEYRLATYLGAKILHFTDKEAVIVQGSRILLVHLLEENAHPLHAPTRGDMSRMIRESPSCRVRYRFIDGEQTLFDFISTQASFESAGQPAN